MAAWRRMCRTVGAGLLAGLWSAGAMGNGGPFVIKYPSGDPAAKGILARLEPDLKPGKESTLRVVKEDLTIRFGTERFSFRRSGAEPLPLVQVSAAYTIANPTDQEVAVDFGFPILRGIYLSPLAMVPMPDMHVMLNGARVQSRLISNSTIYGIIRRQARQTIDQGIATDAELSRLVGEVRANPSKPAAGEAMQKHLVQTLQWNERDANLLLEYARLDLAKPPTAPPPFWDMREPDLRAATTENLGPLAAIGDQKATQFLAQLASRFDPKAAATYEGIFAAWGGDVRERSIDLKSGAIRPREIRAQDAGGNIAPEDTTIYARVEYLDGRAKLSPQEQASMQNILKNLPVVFTFAPMNLLHYQVKFPANSTQVLTVSYAQFAYLDTAEPPSYQVSYVVHPASFWKEFGPINLTVQAPEGVSVAGSVPLTAGHVEVILDDAGVKNRRFTVRKGSVADKTGELFIGVDREQWKRMVNSTAAPKGQQKP